VVTDKNIYFTGPRKSLRLPYRKIVSFEPFSDGVGVMRDAATAKPQIFVTGDGWFTYNPSAGRRRREAQAGERGTSIVRMPDMWYEVSGMSA
jgi:hypothetical protein